MPLLSDIKAEITAIETYLLSYLPVEHHDQIRRAVAVAGANIDAHAQAAVYDHVSAGVDAQTDVPDSAVPTEEPPVQGELPVDTEQHLAP